MILGPVLIAIFILGLALYGVINWKRPPRERLDGWWHQQLPGSHAWTPKAWRQACDLSLSRSRERRTA